MYDISHLRVKVVWGHNEFEVEFALGIASLMLRYFGVITSLGVKSALGIASLILPWTAVGLFF